MNKIEFLEALRHDMSGGSVTNDTIKKYPIPFLAAKVNPLFNQALFEIYTTLKNKNKGFRAFDSLCKVYEDVPVIYNKDRDEYYSNLPTCLASIPQDVAIREVRPMKDAKNAMIQIEANSITTYSKLPVSELFADERMYYLDFDKIYYFNYDEFEKVLMKLIVPFTSYADTDQVPMPVSFTGSLYDKVLNSLKGTFPIRQDLLNNSKTD